MTTPGELFHQRIAEELILPTQLTDLLLAAWCAGAHVLLEGAPGLGKTTLAKTLGEMAGGFGRVQMTADLSPSDLLGWEVLQEGVMSFRKGPVFSRVLLVDEINRATPRTQSALLEAMEERVVHISGQEMVLADDFFVIATQNPFDMDGTFLLPHSQLDRFGCSLKLEAPEGKILSQALRLHESSRSPAGSSMAYMQDRLSYKKLAIHEEWYRVVEELQKLLKSEKARKELGARPLSPRAFLCWLNLARALSWVRGLDHLSTDCLREFLLPVVMHRFDPFRSQDLAPELLGLFDRQTGH